MNRRVIHTAFGRGGSQCTRAGAARRDSRQLSTSTALFDDQPQRPASSRERSEAVASKLGQLSQSRTPSAPSGTPGGGVDARSLAAKPFNKLLVASPRINNLRSLRERGGGSGAPLGDRPPRRFPFQAGAAGGSGSSFGTRGRGGSGFGVTPRPGVGFRARGGGSAGAGAGVGAREGGARGRGNARGGRGRGRGRGGAKRGGAKDGSGPEVPKKLVWSPEEQAVHDRLEQGVVTEYTPSVTLESLVGYGPALATDAALGNVETAMRNMRVLGGGRPFDSTTGVTADPREAVKRYYHEKKPLFFNTPEEKVFLEHSRQGFKIAAPEEATKKVIVDTAILGKYEAPKFAPIGDVLGTMASFHARDVSYHKWESKAFMDKVKSLLPAATAAKASKPAAQAKKAA
ncbi:hypothetical protein B0T22DRAFT_47613 [Podospora appendiculata]|uniref:Uncharacterized protein n=1 Tax=Podospora appendiculata TaxID=314037 RepID=A0AAE0XIQ9_9PEZI|nr:hypothetical protein B0T22DRAFT_47613 [Podospora appendiculata]